MPQLLGVIIFFLTLIPVTFAETIPQNHEFSMVGSIANSGQAKEKDVALIRSQTTGATFAVREGEPLRSDGPETIEAIEVDRIVIRNGENLSAVIRDPFPPSQPANTAANDAGNAIYEQDSYDNAQVDERLSDEIYPEEFYPNEGFAPNEDFSGEIYPDDVFPPDPYIEDSETFSDPLDDEYAETPYGEEIYLPPH